MPRPPRLEGPGAPYHVKARSNERRALFRDDADRSGELAATLCPAVYLARLLCGVSARRVALHLGRDDSTSVRPLARLERLLETDPNGPGES